MGSRGSAATGRGARTTEAGPVSAQAAPLVPPPGPQRTRLVPSLQEKLSSLAADAKTPAAKIVDIEVAPQGVLASFTDKQLGDLRAARYTQLQKVEESTLNALYSRTSKLSPTRARKTEKIVAVVDSELGSLRAERRVNLSIRPQVVELMPLAKLKVRLV